MEGRHVPPRKPKMNQSACLGWCFLATMVIMAILIFVTVALGQEHVFPFKTMDQITNGTTAWVSDGPPQVRFCPGSPAVILKYQYRSGADSIWVVGVSDGIWTAAYFVPGMNLPVAIVIGSVKDGTELVVESNEPYDPAKHTPCGPFQVKSALGGPDGC